MSVLEKFQNVFFAFMVFAMSVIICSIPDLLDSLYKIAINTHR